jgi:acetyltransferase-like isoleucine patch superfamily enzyme
MRIFVQNLLIKIFPELYLLKSPDYDFTKLRSWKKNVIIGKNVNISTVSWLSDSEIGDFSYINDNAIILNTTIGKFCSIGPNFLSGWGIHPTKGISTAPMFYSASNIPNGISLCKKDKIKEHKRITIGNDVFIGANVTVLDGVSVGNGSIIGAGAVVSKDIPTYAIAVGSPIKICSFRFSESQINALLQIQWWNFSIEKLQDVEKMFFYIVAFISKYQGK